MFQITSRMTLQQWTSPGPGLHLKSKRLEVEHPHLAILGWQPV